MLFLQIQGVRARQDGEVGLPTNCYHQTLLLSFFFSSSLRLSPCSLTRMRTLRIDRCDDASVRAYHATTLVRHVKSTSFRPVSKSSSGICAFRNSAKRKATLTRDVCSGESCCVPRLPRRLCSIQAARSQVRQLELTKQCRPTLRPLLFPSLGSDYFRNLVHALSARGPCNTGEMAVLHVCPIRGNPAQGGKTQYD